ncbi:MAG: hypothetical protein KGZ88_11260 [Methylomicrobium sp.]|nr:hypothetical protein [Methylomicrobium sp.]
MRIFDKIFGAKEPAPNFPIHPDDLGLVKNSDLKWWDSLSLNNVISYEKQDNIFRVVALRNFVENEGLSVEQASKKVRKSFIFYYGILQERENEPFGFTGDDAKLPYVLKDRANRAISKIKRMSKQEIDSATSINALIRKILRSE